MRVFFSLPLFIGRSAPYIQTAIYAQINKSLALRPPVLSSELPLEVRRMIQPQVVQRLLLDRSHCILCAASMVMLYNVLSPLLRLRKTGFDEDHDYSEDEHEDAYLTRINSEMRAKLTVPFSLYHWG
jgi:hypothetical protein